jgi:uncharacterized membrane protein
MKVSALGQQPPRASTPAPSASGQQEESHDDPSAAVEENVRTVSAWEQTALDNRSHAERLGDWITATAASGPVLVAHVVWFALWAVVNTGLVPRFTPFDPFPFPLLTMTVSLEAIFLALFVLASQNRLAHQSDKRAQLDLQVNLLAEREMTVVLQLLQGIAAQLGVKTAISNTQLRDLAKETDIPALTHKLDQAPGGEAQCEPGRFARGGSR